jgi:hypothetical protein
MPPHSQSYDTRILDIVIALKMLAGSELTSEEVSRAHARAGKKTLAINGAGELSTAACGLARLTARLEHAVHVPEYQLPQS